MIFQFNLNYLPASQRMQPKTKILLLQLCFGQPTPTKQEMKQNCLGDLNNESNILKYS